MTYYGPLLSFSCAFFQLICSLGHQTRHGRTSFASFVEKHGRSYQPGTPTYDERSRLFYRNLAAVEEHNSNPNRLWDASVNRLSDWTNLELGMLRDWSGSKASNHEGDARHRGGVFLSQFKKPDRLPKDFNWTHLKAAPKFVDQGSCGSCWALTSATVLEMHTEIYRKETRTFSASELVACVPNTHGCGGTGGCEGSTVELAFDYVMSRGLPTSEISPMTSVQSMGGYSGVCMQSGKASFIERIQDAIGIHIVKSNLPSLLATNEIAQITAPGVHDVKATQPGGLLGMRGWERLPENKQEPVMRAIVERGPVAVTVAASSWQNYDRGIFDGCAKDAIVDHAVVLVGYGIEHLTKYWTIHNSWGTQWGERGNMRLKRFNDDDEYCGIDKQPEQGTTCKGGPKQVTVCGMCGILYDTVVPHFVHEEDAVR